MIVVDSSIWIDHFNTSIPLMDALLKQRKVLVHPLAQGEVMVGSLRRREVVRAFLNGVEQAPLIANKIVLEQLERWQAYNRGVGWVDMHLLSSAHALQGKLWTRDRRLGALAEELGLRFVEP